MTARKTDWTTVLLTGFGLLVVYQYGPQIWVYVQQLFSQASAAVSSAASGSSGVAASSGSASSPAVGSILSVPSYTPPASIPAGSNTVLTMGPQAATNPLGVTVPRDAAGPTTTSTAAGTASNLPADSDTEPIGSYADMPVDTSGVDVGGFVDDLGFE